jgi:hypothetical protein
MERGLFFIFNIYFKSIDKITQFIYIIIKKYDFYNLLIFRIIIYFKNIKYTKK